MESASSKGLVPTPHTVSVDIYMGREPSPYLAALRSYRGGLWYPNSKSRLVTFMFSGIKVTGCEGPDTCWEQSVPPTGSEKFAWVMSSTVMYSGVFKGT